MHIPDGYLGPLTCGVMYAVMLPIWWMAAKAAKEKLGDKSVQLIWSEEL